MRLFDRAQPVVDGRIYIPYAMRAALGWHDGRHLYCWTRKTPAGQESQLSISALMPSDDVWTLVARFHDRPKLLAELSTLLHTQTVNIVTARASTHTQNREFVIDMEIDTNVYRRGGRTRDPGLRELFTLIVCHFIRDIVFEGGAPSLHIVQNPVFNPALSALFVDSTRIDDEHSVIIDSERMHSIEAYYGRRYGESMKARTGASAVPLALLVADVDADLIDVTFFYPHTGHIHVRIKAEDRIGALEIITTAFGGFNILQAYHRTIEKNRRSETDLFLRLEPSVPDGEVDREVNRVIATTAMRNLKAEREHLKPLTVKSA